MSSPRVLIIGNFLSAHGASRGVCEELAPRLEASGWTVSTTSDKRFRPARLADMLSAVWKRRRDYDVAQVDVYSGPAFSWAEAVCWMLRQIGRPYVLTLHGGALPQFARRRRERVARLLKSAQAVTVPSPYLLQQMAEFRHDLTLLPNGLEIAAYASQPVRAMEPRLIWLRAFHGVYNPMMAPRVLARLTAEFPSIHLTMAGPDKGDGAYQKTVDAAKACGVDGHLDIRGPVPKAGVPALLAQGDIFLNTSNVDNTPVSVLEAMASGMCVVSTEVGGIPYLLKSGDDALLVPPDDDAAMASAVRRILLDRALAGRLQVASMRKVRQFDWPVVLLKWQELLTSVAADRRRRARAEVA
jgi:glycosyltransferase involved in cell wall biosynthesis